MSADDNKRDQDLSIELGDKQPNGTYAASRSPSVSPAPSMSGQSKSGINVNSPVLAIVAYCGSSILMTVSNKYCVSGTGWNLTFFLLAVQVCVERGDT